MAEKYQTPEEFLRALESTPQPHANDELVPHGERTCPICGGVMIVQVQFAVSLDLCPSHGVWLDLGELESIAGAAKMASPSVRQWAIERARREGKMSGIAYGWLSLFID